MSDALQPDDRQLLRRFAADRSEAAFGELVTRHVTLVYSAALRQTGGDAHRAQDIAQLVFTDLARKAPALAENIVLAGWLHRATIFAARQILRGERRRRIREQEAVTMNPIQSEMTHDEWIKIRPLLDEALERLNKTDRDALLLRFFEQQSLAQIGERLGSNEDAARKRVQRALEKLRTLLSKRGVTTTAAALSAVITANAMPAAPAGLALGLTSTSFVAAGTGTLTLLKIMTATKIKLAFSALVVAGAATALVIQQQTQNKLRDANAAQQQQIAQLQNDNASLSNRLADTGDTKKITDEQFNELLKLRGEVGVLRRQVGEFRNLREENQKQQTVLKTLDTRLQQQAIADAEKQEQETFILKLNDAKQGTLAFVMYAGDNPNQFPTNIDQVTNYLGSVSEQVKTNFDLAYQGSINKIINPSSAIVLKEKQAWQTIDGKWAKVYGFADGHAEAHTEPNDNFIDFENEHAVLLLENQ